MTIFPNSQHTRRSIIIMLVVAFAAAGLLLLDRLQTSSAVGAGPEMALVVEGVPEESCEGGVCQLELGAPFTLGVDIISPPNAGYVAAQSYIVYGDDLTYNQAASAEDEMVWPDCEPAIIVREQADARNPNVVVTDAVNHGCVAGLLPPIPVSTLTGGFLRLSMNCSAADTVTNVQMLPYIDQLVFDNDLGMFVATTKQGTSGSAFGEPAASGFTNLPPKLTNITIICGEPPTPTPAPTITPGGPTITPTTTPTPTPAVTAKPTPSPTPDVTETPTPVPATATPVPRPCGDINGDGRVDSQDALWVLWLTTGVIEFVPFADDLDRDGRLGPIDALLILQIAANLFICR